MVTQGLVQPGVGAGALELTVTVAVRLEDAPALSVTVAVTVNVPAFTYVCCAEGPAALLPSPQLIIDAAIVPSTSVEAAVDADTLSGAVPDVGVTESCATG